MPGEASAGFELGSGFVTIEALITPAITGIQTVEERLSMLVGGSYPVTIEPKFTQENIKAALGDQIIKATIDPKGLTESISTAFVGAAESIQQKVAAAVKAGVAQGMEGFAWAGPKTAPMGGEHVAAPRTTAAPYANEIAETGIPLPLPSATRSPSAINKALAEANDFAGTITAHGGTVPQGILDQIATLEQEKQLALAAKAASRMTPAQIAAQPIPEPARTWGEIAPYATAQAASPFQMASMANVPLPETRRAWTTAINDLMLEPGVAPPTSMSGFAVPPRDAAGLWGSAAMSGPIAPPIRRGGKRGGWARGPADEAEELSMFGSEIDAGPLASLSEIREPGEGIARIEKAASASWESRMIKRMALRFAVMAAVFKTAQFSQNMAQAEDTERHPLDFLPKDAPGSPDNFMADAGLRTNSTAMARLKASDERWSGFGWFDLEKQDRQRLSKNIQEGMAQTEYGIKQERQLPIEILQAQGFKSDAAERENQDKLRGAQLDISRAEASARTTFRAAHQRHWWDLTTQGQAFGVMDERDIDRDEGVQRAVANYQKQQQLGSIQSEQVRVREVAEHQQVSGNIFASEYGDLATRTESEGVQRRTLGVRRLAAGGPGAELSAMRDDLAGLIKDREALGFRQTGANLKFSGDTEAAVATAAPENKDRVRAERLAQSQEMQSGEAKARFESDEKIAQQDKRIRDYHRESALEIVQINAQADAEIQSAHHQSYEAQLSDLAAYAARRRDATRSSSKEEQQAVENEISARGAAAGYQYREGLIAAQGKDETVRENAGLAVRGDELRMQRRFNEANLLKYESQQHELNQENANVDRLPFEQQASRRAALEERQRQLYADRKLTEFEDTRQQSLSGFQLDARREQAEDRLGNQTLTARATGEVAHAREAVANADPRQRAKVIETERAELKAAEHEMVGYRSGATSGSMTIDEALLATGFGMDLGGKAKDRRAASAKLLHPDLDTPIPGTDSLTAKPAAEAKPGFGIGPGSIAMPASALTKPLPELQGNTWVDDHGVHHQTRNTPKPEDTSRASHSEKYADAKGPWAYLHRGDAAMTRNIASVRSADVGDHIPSKMESTGQQVGAGQSAGKNPDVDAAVKQMVDGIAAQLKSALIGLSLFTSGG